MYVWLHIIIIYLQNLEEYKIVCEECRAGKRGCVACKKQLASKYKYKIRTNKRKKKIL